MTDTDQLERKQRRRSSFYFGSDTVDPETEVEHPDEAEEVPVDIGAALEEKVAKYKEEVSEWKEMHRALNERYESEKKLKYNTTNDSNTSLSYLSEEDREYLKSVREMLADYTQAVRSMGETMTDVVMMEYKTRMNRECTRLILDHFKRQLAHIEKELCTQLTNSNQISFSDDAKAATCQDNVDDSFVVCNESS